ncbi:MAG TPA: ABC transporter permease subunit, partial [Nannocystis exedens]|nr:ABC transporter permease subunit [Nannocystis exedens]
MRRPGDSAALWVALYALLSLVLPLLCIVFRAFTEGGASGSAAISAEVWMLSGARALGLAGIVAGFACVAAYPLAIVVPAPLLFGLFLVSPLARALGVLGLGVQPGVLAVGLAQLGGALPLAGLLVLQRLRGLDPRLLAAAADLGASPWIRFRTITLPLLWPALATAGLWTVLISIGDIATLELAGGGKFYSLGLVLREVAFAMGNDALLAAITAALLLLALPCAYVLLRGISALGGGSAVARVAGIPRVRRCVPAQIPFGVIACTALGIAALPFVGLLIQVQNQILRPQVAATVLTPLRYAVEPTLRVLPSVAVVATLCGFSLALLRSRLPIWAGVLVVLPLAIPPAVQGILALEMGRWMGVAPGEGLTLWGLFPTCFAIAYLG